jgi:tetratricopeptide (TPR) repeat protein
MSHVSRVSVGTVLSLSLLTAGLLLGCVAAPLSAQPGQPTNLQRAKVFLAAGDYRRAVEACRQEVQDHPSTESYLYLTYVYQALDAYVESLAKADQWVAMEHLYLNLIAGEPEDLVDPSNVLARIAKEMIQSAARQQADVSAEQATRLDPSAVARIWPQQTAWRKIKPDGWWFAVPPEWAW